jgi:ABC-type sulfate transport system permease subunit
MSKAQADIRFMYAVAGFVLATQFFTFIYILMPRMGVI